MSSTVREVRSDHLSAGALPVCELSVIHTDVVDELRPRMDDVAGIAPLFKALADDTRLKVVYALSKAELCVCDVAALIGGTTATASYHLRLLNNLGLADYRREGKLVYYRLADTDLGRMVHDMLERVCRMGQGGE